MKLKHTPGPWEITGAYKHLFAAKQPVNNANCDLKFVIGEMWSIPWKDREKYNEEREANTRLVYLELKHPQ